MQRSLKVLCPLSSLSLCEQATIKNHFDEREMKESFTFYEKTLLSELDLLEKNTKLDESCKPWE